MAAQAAEGVYRYNHCILLELPQHCLTMDARIHMGLCMLVCGPAGGGKTSFVIRLIESAPRTFDAQPAYVYWFYGVETEQQPLLTKKGFITYCSLPDNFDFCEQNSIIVLDDLMDAAGHHQGVTDLFTKLAHHKNLFVIFIQQNLLPRQPDARTRSLNSQYIVLFRSSRDNFQIDVLGRQIYPSKKHYLLNIYLSVTRDPYFYLFIDLHQRTSELIRFRTNVLPSDDAMFAYVDKHLYAQTFPLHLQQT